VEAVYRTESRRVLATLIRVLGDFELAEDALHDAFAAAVEQWPRDGVPATRAPGWSRPGASRPSTPAPPRALRRVAGGDRHRIESDAPTPTSATRTTSRTTSSV
jgi:predicted RNA polymerase sigma factor